MKKKNKKVASLVQDQMDNMILHLGVSRFLAHIVDTTKTHVEGMGKAGEYSYVLSLLCDAHNSANALKLLSKSKGEPNE